jgi:hypothetical protein
VIFLKPFLYVRNAALMAKGVLEVAVDTLVHRHKQP